jgi:hypothetical protein
MHKNPSNQYQKGELQIIVSTKEDLHWRRLEVDLFCNLKRDAIEFLGKKENISCTCERNTPKHREWYNR